MYHVLCSWKRVADSKPHMVAETETNGILPFHQESSKTIALQRKYWKFNFFMLLKVICGICKTNRLTYIPMFKAYCTYKRWWKQGLLVRVFSATFYNISAISWRSVLLVREIRVPGENYRPVTSHWQTLSHNVVSSTPRHERDSSSQCVWWYALFATTIPSRTRLLFVICYFKYIQNKLTEAKWNYHYSCCI